MIVDEFIRITERLANVASWLQADLLPPKIDFRYYPDIGHFLAHAGLPYLTHV